MKKKLKSGDPILWIFFAIALLIFTVQNAFPQSNPNDVLKLKISANGYSDETFIRFKNNASVSYESDNDAWKLFSMNPDVPMVFTKIDGGAASLNTLPTLGKKVYIDLFTKIKNPGNYTIESKILSPFSSSPEIFLVDKISGTVKNISKDTSITTFLPADSGIVPRYQVYFSTVSVIQATGLSCFKNMDGKIFFDNLSSYGWFMNIKDENLVYNQDFTGNSSSFEVDNLHPGTYTINISNQFESTETFVSTVTTPFPVLSIFEPSAETLCLCDNATVSLNNTSPGAKEFSWNFGDGSATDERNPSHQYNQAGNYIISLFVTDGPCSDISYKQITVVESFPLTIKEKDIADKMIIYFNGENYILNAAFSKTENIIIDIYNMPGQLVHTQEEQNVYQQDIVLKVPGKGPFIFSLRTSGHTISRIVL